MGLEWVENVFARQSQDKRLSQASHERTFAISLLASFPANKHAHVRDAFESEFRGQVLMLRWQGFVAAVATAKMEGDTWHSTN